jgi:hypothetical protein
MKTLTQQPDSRVISKRFTDPIPIPKAEQIRATRKLDWDDIYFHFAVSPQHFMIKLEQGKFTDEN